MMKCMGNCIGNFMLSTIYSNAYSRKGQLKVDISVSKGKLYFEPSRM